MKKTLLLLALLGGIPAQAEIVSYFAEGYNAENIQSAYNNRIYGSMCWGANASNIMGWWQERLQEQGYTLPDGTPTGYNIYDEYKAAFVSKGGYGDSAIEWWLDGYYYGQKAAEGHPGGYYTDLVLPMEHNDYRNTGTMIKQFFPATSGSLAGYSTQIKECLENGYALATRIPEKSFNITIWGADYDTETGLLTKLWYADPHDTYKIWHGDLTPSADAVGQDTFYLSGMGTLSTITGISCHIEDYLSEAAYTDTGNGCFAPVYNVQLNSGAEYVLDKALKTNDTVHGDVTIGNGTVKVTGEGCVAGSVIFAETEEAGAARTLAVQRDGLVLSDVRVNAASGNTLAVEAGKEVSITAMAGEGTLVKTGEGTLLNGGVLGNLVLPEGTLKGSGTFGTVTVEGGTLIIGNSPGYQNYAGDLTVTDGVLVFCVDGLATASSAESTGWGSDTYSIIHMNDHEFNYEGGQIFIDLSGAAAEALTLGAELTLVDGMGNVLTEEQLSALAANTSFRLTAEEGAAVTFNTENLVQPNFRYGMSGSSLMLTIVPEPATVTLSLLALAGLCTRRRRRH